MNKLMEDLLDVKPLPAVTGYAGGTALQGVAVGILIAYFVPAEFASWKWSIAGVAYAVGAVLTLFSFSRLKRRYRIVPIEKSDP